MIVWLALAGSLAGFPRRRQDDPGDNVIARLLKIPSSNCPTFLSEAWKLLNTSRTKKCGISKYHADIRRQLVYLPFPAIRRGVYGICVGLGVELGFLPRAARTAVWR